MGIFRRDAAEKSARDAARAEVDHAKVAAQAALPPGWRLERADLERFRLPTGSVETWAMSASGPGDDDVRLAVGIGQAGGYRALEALLRGAIEPTDMWAPPLPMGGGGVLGAARFSLYDAAAPDVAAALGSLEAALPPGWQPFGVDRSRYRLPGQKVEVYGVSAVGPAGASALAIGIGEATGLRALASMLQGGLTVSELWAVRTDLSSVPVG
ncbi:MAG: hypothetical protein ACRDV1_10900 [Actinomycetes bacterium]